MTRIAAAPEVSKPQGASEPRGVWNSRDAGKLAAALALISGVWLVLLPQLSRRPETAAHLRELDRQGIDASAMFYTELEMMEALLSRIEDPNA